MRGEGPLPSQDKLQVALRPSAPPGDVGQRAAAQVKCRDEAAVIDLRSGLFVSVHGQGQTMAVLPTASDRADFFCAALSHTFSDGRP